MYRLHKHHDHRRPRTAVPLQVEVSVYCLLTLCTHFLSHLAVQTHKNQIDIELSRSSLELTQLSDI